MNNFYHTLLTSELTWPANRHSTVQNFEVVQAIKIFDLCNHIFALYRNLLRAVKSVSAIHQPKRVRVPTPPITANAPNPVAFAFAKPAKKNIYRLPRRAISYRGTLRTAQNNQPYPRSLSHVLPNHASFTLSRSALQPSSCRLVIYCSASATSIPSVSHLLCCTVLSSSKLCPASLNYSIQILGPWFLCEPTIIIHDTHRNYTVSRIWITLNSDFYKPWTVIFFPESSSSRKRKEFLISWWFSAASW